MTAGLVLTFEGTSNGLCDRFLIVLVSWAPKSAFTLELGVVICIGPVLIKSSYRRGSIGNIAL
jgi:hypothetical protein